MINKKTLMIAALMTLGLNACGPRLSEVTPNGSVEGTYTVSAKDLGGSETSAALEMRTMQAARMYCEKENKGYKVVHSSETGTTGLTSTSSTLLFKCEGTPDKN